MATYTRRTTLSVAAAAPAAAALTSASQAYAGVPAHVGVLTTSAPAFASALRRQLTGSSTVTVRDAATLGTGPALEELVTAGVDVVVAQVTHPSAFRVQDICEQAGVRLVVANRGAHMRGPRGVETVTLDHWQSWFALGRWARSKGRTMFQIVAEPDAGYDTIFAARRGFASAGGAVLGSVSTHQGTSIAAAVRAAEASGAQVVAVHATGARGADILRRVRGLDATVLADSLADTIPNGAFSAAPEATGSSFSALAKRVAAHLDGRDSNTRLAVHTHRAGRRVLVGRLAKVGDSQIQMRVLDPDASAYTNEYGTI